MIFHWPQLVWITLALVGVGIAIEQHGKPRTGKHNMWSSIVAFILAWFTLYFGGFFAGISP